MNAVFRIKCKTVMTDEFDAIYLGTGISTANKVYRDFLYIDEKGVSRARMFDSTEVVGFKHFVDEKGRRYDATLKPIKDSNFKKHI